MKSKYYIDVFDKKDIENLGADLSQNNDYITETAGFVPLEVKMKQFEQNGIIAQFKVSDFTSSDYRDMYLNPDFDITPEDDFEEVEEKLNMQREFISNLKKPKAANGLSAAEADDNKTKEEVKEKEEPSKKE